MKETLVVIFYIADEAQGSEITLAIEGWRQHFKEPHRIVVVGDKPPVDGVGWIKIDRIPEKAGEYRPHLDICRKLEAVCIAFMDEYDGFIWSCDDFFAVNDFTLADVLVPKIQDEEMPPRGDNHPNSWLRNLVKTRKLCDTEGFGIANWVTHLPVWFDIRKLFRVIQDYDLTENSYVVENIYFNKFIPDGNPQKLCDADRWKFGVYFTPLNRIGLHDAFSRKIWVCCSVHGWSDALEEELRKHYGLPAKGYFK